MPERPETYWRSVFAQFRKNRIAVCSFVIVCGLLSLAIFADFIANDKPLILHYQGSTSSPVLTGYAVGLGLTRWRPELQNISFKSLAAHDFNSGDWAWFPPVRYSPNDVDLNQTLQPPSSQHFLGTDES